VVIAVVLLAETAAFLQTATAPILAEPRTSYDTRAAKVVVTFAIIVIVVDFKQILLKIVFAHANMRVGVVFPGVIFHAGKWGTTASSAQLIARLLELLVIFQCVVYFSLF
jgi:hypothetical protein